MSKVGVIEKQFEEEWVTKKNIYGKTCSFKKYILKRKEEKDVYI